jgi:hypothetical protein
MVPRSWVVSRPAEISPLAVSSNWHLQSQTRNNYHRRMIGVLFGDPLGGRAGCGLAITVQMFLGAQFAKIHTYVRSRLQSRAQTWLVLCFGGW